LEDLGLWRSIEGRRALADRPHSGLQEVEECLGFADGVEVEIDDDVVSIVDRLLDALPTYAGLFAELGESFKRLSPEVEVGDWVLDVQGRHGRLLDGMWASFEVRDAPRAAAIPDIWGLRVGSRLVRFERVAG